MLLALLILPLVDSVVGLSDVCLSSDACLLGVDSGADLRMLHSFRVLLAEWTSVADLNLWLLLLDRVLTLLLLGVKTHANASWADLAEAVDGVALLTSEGNHGR
jgi:hypothetical protein